MRIAPIFVSAQPSAMRFRRLAGITDAGLSAATSSLMSQLSANGCRTVFVQQVADFQSAWNAAGAGTTLTVDGLYGAKTSAALQQALDANADQGMSQTVPAGCVADLPKSGGGGGSGNVTIPPVVITPGGSPSSPTQSVTVGSSNYMPIAIAVAAGAAIIGYSIYAKKHGRTRHAGHR